MAMGRSESHLREELLAASDEVIEDAVVHADLKALRGLLYQLTGDDEVARARLNIDDPATMLSGDPDDTELLRRKGAEFLKGYRDRGAGAIVPRDHLGCGVGRALGDVESGVEESGRRHGRQVLCAKGRAPIIAK